MASAQSDPVLMLEPLAALAPRLAASPPDLAAEVDALTRHAERQRHDSDGRRS